MKKVKNQNDKGITLITLIVTIIVILILASVATYSGIDAIKSSEFTRFTSELKIMQTQVNNLYEKYQNKEQIKGKEILEYGTEINANSQVENQVSKVFNADASGIEDSSGYKYYDKQTIKELGIEGVEQEFFVNIQKRSVISYLGIKYEDKTYYTIEQIPNGLYNVEYKENKENPTFDVNINMIGENKYQVTVQNIQYSGYNDKWKVRYQKEGSEYWNTSEELSFTVNEAGKYNITIKNGEIESSSLTKYVGYVKDGLVLHYDGIINTKKGQNIETTNWEDLSGNNNDGKIDGCIWSDNSLSFDGIDDYVLIGKLNYPNITMEVVVSNDNINSSETEYISNYEGGGYGLSYSTKNFFSVYTDKYYRVYGSNVIVNEIYSLSGSYDNNNLVLYENGTKNFTSLTGTLTEANNNTALCLGTNPSGDTGTAYWLNGKIYSVRIYNRALTEDEVRTNYELDKKRFNIQ